MLVRYLSENNTNQYIKEEAIWAFTNLSILSSPDELEFLPAAYSLMKMIRLEKIDNLGSLLNLKQ